MIEQIKKIIEEHKGTLKKGDFMAADLRVSKFFHGNPSFNTKVLFLVFLHQDPLCILKVARSVDVNPLLEREIKGLEYFAHNNLKVPRMFFSGQINGLSFVCEEVLVGLPVGKKDESIWLPQVVSYHTSVKKIKIITIGTLLELFDGIDTPHDKEFMQTTVLLSQRVQREVWLAPQHGDVTSKNLIVHQGEVYFIDFENFNMRPVWGLDLVHYMTRLVNAHNEGRDVKETLAFFVSSVKKCKEYPLFGLSDGELEDLFLLDLFFEILQKNLFKRKAEILPLMEKIWSL